MFNVMPRKDAQELTVDEEALIALWRDWSNYLNRAKTQEADLRKRLVTELPFTAEKEEGAETIILTDGTKLKAEKVFNYTVSEKDNAKVTAALMALRDAVGDAVASQIIRWTPELREGQYKNLPPHAKAILANIVKITPGMPTFEVIPPKVKE